MPAVKDTDVERMTSGLFIERPWNSRSASKFWTLLVLAAIIASAGVISDSTATVIGAMIVAPLMTPILGSALGLVLADRRHLFRSAAFVVGGAAVVVALSFVIGMIVASPPDLYAGNSQVSGRISPRLIDLFAALATGTVGSFALVRSDVSDALPGVAIAISLVPPLCVVGILLGVRRFADAGGAALLFGTNVAAIVATGTAVMLIYRVREAAAGAGYPVGRLTGLTLAIVIGLVVAVAVPLTVGSISLIRDERLAIRARPVAQQWATAQHWQITAVNAKNGTVIVSALGPPPTAQTSELRQLLNQNGMSDSDLAIALVVGGSQRCPAGGDTCDPVGS